MRATTRRAFLRGLLATPAVAAMPGLVDEVLADLAAPTRVFVPTSREVAVFGGRATFGSKDFATIRVWAEKVAEEALRPTFFTQLLDRDQERETIPLATTRQEGALLTRLVVEYPRVVLDGERIGRESLLGYGEVLEAPSIVERAELRVSREDVDHGDGQRATAGVYVDGQPVVRRFREERQLSGRGLLASWRR